MKILKSEVKKDLKIVTVGLDPQEFEQTFIKVQKDLAANVKLPGFRKGKVPFEKAVLSLNLKNVYETLINKASKQMAVFVDESEDPQTEDIFGEPVSMDLNKFDPEKKELICDFSYETLPAIVQLDDYSVIELPQELQTEISDQEVDKYIENILNQNAMVSTKEDSATNKDVVVFDFEGFLNKEPLDNATATNYELDLANSNFIPGYAENLVGLKAGEEKTFEVVFPQDYHEPKLAGQPVEFKVKVNQVKQKNLPTLNDEFVASLNLENITTVDAYKKHIKEELKKQLDLQNDEIKNQKVIDWIVNDRNVLTHFPKQAFTNLIQEQYLQLKDNIDTTFKAMGGFKQYLKMLNTTEEQLRYRLSLEAFVSLKSQAVFKALKEVLKLNLTDKDLEETKELLKNNLQYQQRFANQNNLNLEDKNNLMNVALQIKCLDFLKSKIKSVKPETKTKQKDVDVIKTPKNQL